MPLNLSPAGIRYERIRQACAASPHPSEEQKAALQEAAQRMYSERRHADEIAKSYAPRGTGEAEEDWIVRALDVIEHYRDTKPTPLRMKQMNTIRMAYCLPVIPRPPEMPAGADSYRGYHHFDGLDQQDLIFGFFPNNMTSSPTPEDSTGCCVFCWTQYGIEMSAFDDAWLSLSAMPDVIAAMATLNGDATPQDVIDVLIFLGFESYRFQD